MSRLEIDWRPIEVWPAALRTDRKLSPFTASWRDTLGVLGRELDHLGADRCTLQLALPAGSFTKDGYLKANARTPDHPGVVISFTSVHGPLTYHTDVYNDGWYVSANEGRRGWRGNVRAIALGLEGLRKFGRYGIATKGEQYQGWKALGSGLALPEHAAFTPEQACRVFFDLLADVGWWSEGDTPGSVLDEAQNGDPAGSLKAGYRNAAKIHHPDTQGGDRTRFEALDESWRVLQGLAS
jgi:hypothetical protein